MARSLSTACLLAILAAPAWADRVLLTNGRTISGVVTVEGDSVQIVMEFGTVRVPRNEVVSIEEGDTPEMELAKKLSALPDANSTSALCEVAKWASQNGLSRQAEDLFRRVVRLDPDHAAARSALDYAKIEGEWRTFAQGLELARNKLDAGQFGPLLQDVLPALDPLANTRERQVALGELAATAHLRSAKIALAAREFDDLAAKAGPVPAAIRFAAIAEVLKENPDGMYVLAEPYPPAGELLGGDQPSVKAGPASLTDPRVLQAALAEKARKDIAAARQLLDELRKGDGETYRLKAAQAARSLDRAEATSPGIARSYRVELVRIRIERVRTEVDQQARDFDKEMSSLGKSDLPPAAYRAKVQKLIGELDAIRDNLKDIIEATRSFPRDLLLEAKWAEYDQKKIKDMRDVLAGELDVRK